LGIDLTNSFRKNVRDLVFGPSVHRDVAAADAIETAIKSGKLLANEIRNDIAASARDTNLDISYALDAPLAIIDGGSGITEPGSLLQAACVGTVAAVGIRELILSRLASSQDGVLHAKVARGIAAWEVGQENVGDAPSPWQGGAHISWSKGTLSGGRTSVANKLMETFIMTGQTTREENAQFFAQTIVASLGLSPDPCAARPPQVSVLNRLGLGSGLPILPKSAINTVAERILAIDLFWPSYLDGKEVIW